MKIYSWNMLFRNKELDRAFHFIAKSDFDIFCLQEVPDHFLTKLKTLPYHLAESIDVVRLLPHGAKTNHVVILSKYPISDTHAIPFPDYWHLLPLRGRFFVRVLRGAGFSKIKGRGGQYADLHTPLGTVRLFNMHLVLANPQWRLQEFEKAMTERNPELPTIVCGDFNILESLHITPLNWIFGGHFGDSIFHRRERIHVEKRFFEHTLRNALLGKQTHSFSRSQLDHILVSKHFEIDSAEVIHDCVGSDHNPISVSVT